MEEIPAQPEDGVQLIVAYGSESTGKTQVSKQLAGQFRVPLVLEYARTYLQDLFDNKGLICRYNDLLPIARGQRQAENSARKQTRSWVMCDTNLLQTLVYSKAYFNKVPQALENAVHNSTYTHYLLMDTDLEWEKDPLRDKPSERREMHALFKEELETRKLPYTLISGKGQDRFNTAHRTIQRIINE